MKFEIFGWFIQTGKVPPQPTKQERALQIRRAYEARLIERVAAVKEIRSLFLHDIDEGFDRGTLKGALYFLEGRPL